MPDSRMTADMPASAARPALGEALRFWTRLGWISFGGPAGQIAIMHDELVERRRWVDEPRFLHALNYCMLLPGPEAQQLATYLGWMLHGPIGGIAAGLLFILPSVFILIAAAWAYCAFGNTVWLGALLAGVKPAVVAVVAAAGVRMGRRTLRHPWAWAVAAAAFVALAGLHAPFPAIIAAAAFIGYAVGRLRPGWLGRAPDAHATDGPATASAGFRRSTFVLTVVATLAIWLVALGGLMAVDGPGDLRVPMAWFFSKAALLTFGGAYAVLPYVQQAMVDSFHWITANQMIDALALGETTPGPLIMVVAFVGFVADWNRHAADAAWAWSASASALVAVFFTFLPSFGFILAGAPLVEATRGRLAFTAPLAGITAAVVGVIANLGVYFAAHVMFPDGPGGGPQWFAIILSVTAAFALIRLHWNVIAVIGLCAAIGLLRGAISY